MKHLLSYTFIGFIIFTTGCLRMEKVVEPVGHYYLSPGADFSTVGKVVIVELDNQTVTRDLGQTMTRALADGMGKKHLFTVGTLSPDNPAWQSLNIDQVLRDYTLEDLAQISSTLKADAVVFGTIPRYSSYPRLQMGISLKMLDLRTGKLIWAIEQVWDTTDKQLENRIKRYFDKEMRSGYQPMDWQLVITSPNAFHKFVVYEIISTLPDVQVGRKTGLW